MSDEHEELLAQQLLAQLEGETVPEADEESRALGTFAQGLSWPGARPDADFRERLRQRLLRRPAAPWAFLARLPRWSVVSAAAVLVIVVAGLLAVLGPGMSDVFSGRGGADREVRRLAAAPAKETVVVMGAPQVVYATVPAGHEPVPPSVLYDSSPYSVPEVTPLPGATPGTDVGPSLPASAGRMVIKDAQLQLLVEDTDIALDRLTGIAGQYGGYILSSQSWYDQGYKQATIVIQVPAEYFEQALNRVRQVALEVERETTAGQDVTEQYVDLESQLRNLEATAVRLRAFLDKAVTMEEALRINNELSRIEGQIEQVKGRMNFLAAKSAFSTISIDLHPPRPTPTPTPTLTPTPTSTPTPTPTPSVWQPGQTAGQATSVLGAIGRFVVDALIWVGLVLLPVVGVPALIIALIVWAVRRGKKHSPPAA